MIDFLKEFFGFSKKELNGLLIFCFIILLVALAPYLYSYLHPPQQYDYSTFAKKVASFRASAKEKPVYSYRNFKTRNPTAFDKTSAPDLFSFNPNGLSNALWKKLGLSQRQINVIKNFEAKGGKFYRKEDLKKIYSIKADQYLMLEPYINIPERVYPPYPTSFEKKAAAVKVLRVIELNGADSIQLESVNGIGPAFASRIIKYRNRLGGFYRKEQIKEVYGLDSLFYEKLQNQLTVNPSSIQRILINNATFADLKRHPYLNYKQMNAIIQYRKQHGVYKSLNDLKRVVILDEEVLNRLAPYLSFE